MFEYLIITVMAVFVIVNPLTTAFVFSSAAAARLRGASASDRLARHSGRLVFATLGGVIFQLFGITLAAFRIAVQFLINGIGEAVTEFLARRALVAP